MVDKVLEILIPCGEEEMEKGNFELALDHFNELLELVHFRFLPGVLLMKAKCLLRLVRKKRWLSFPVNSKNMIAKGSLLGTENSTSLGWVLSSRRVIRINPPGLNTLKA